MRRWSGRRRRRTGLRSRQRRAEQRVPRPMGRETVHSQCGSARMVCRLAGRGPRISRRIRRAGRRTGRRSWMGRFTWTARAGAHCLCRTRVRLCAALASRGVGCGAPVRCWLRVTPRCRTSSWSSATRSGARSSCRGRLSMASGWRRHCPRRRSPSSASPNHARRLAGRRASGEARRPRGAGAGTAVWLAAATADRAKRASGRAAGCRWLRSSVLVRSRCSR
mmetsp:Transcript_22641/g.73224  ORF Transcript_22641/g.73224 Transcript_22641/m.73224 type:complete len:222 (+) Transcript_22641:863-1528(+)